MNSSESITKVAAKLAAVQHEAPLVPKGETTTSGPRYSYASMEDYEAILQPLLRKHDLLVIFSAGKIRSLPERLLADGKRKEYVVQVEILATIIDPESGEWIEINAAGEDQSLTGKATYGAITGARKYALASLFNLCTSDDPERGQQTNSSTASASTVAPAKQQAPPQPQTQPQTQPQQFPTDDTLGVNSVERFKEGENPTGHWVLWHIHCDDGVHYDTFSDADADTAQACQAAGRRAIIQWEQGKYGRQIKTIAPADQADQADQAAPPQEQALPEPAVEQGEQSIMVSIETVDSRQALHKDNEITVMGVNTDQGRFGCLDTALFDDVQALAGTDSKVSLMYETTKQGRLIKKIAEIPF